MTSGKPIEPGCLAITLSAVFAENKGRIVRVKELYMAETDMNQRIWTIEFPRPVLVTHLHGRGPNGTELSNIAHHPELYLRRIDSDEDLTEELEDDVDARDAADVLRSYDSQTVPAVAEGCHQPSGAGSRG